MQYKRHHIIIADDHTLVADACRSCSNRKYDVVATVGDGRALVRIAATLKPQVIIMDIGMPLLNGLDAGYQVKQLPFGEVSVPDHECGSGSGRRGIPARNFSLSCSRLAQPRI